MDTAIYRSTDGGEHFEPVKAAPGGDDYHSLWIAPDDPQRLSPRQRSRRSHQRGRRRHLELVVQSTDRAVLSTSSPTIAFRIAFTARSRIAAQLPYSSRSDYGEITFRDWSPIGGEESGYIVVDRADPDTVYGGGPFGVVRRFNWITGQSFDISPAAIRYNNEKLRLRGLRH